MKPYKYELVVSWSHEDQLFVVDVPDLPGCMAHGSTPTDAVRNAEDAVALWIDSARDDGAQIPEPRARRTAIER